MEGADLGQRTWEAMMFERLNGGEWLPVHNLSSLCPGDTVRRTSRARDEVWGVMAVACVGNEVKVYAIAAQCLASEKIKP